MYDVSDEIKVIQVGLGPLGQQIVRDIYKKKSIKIIGAVDKSIERIGEDLGEVCNLGKKVGILIEENIRIEKDKPDVAIITTVSMLSGILQAIEEFATDNINVISSCEELVYPWKTNPELAMHIDKIAKKNGIFVLGTGVNPGFLMDFLPIVLSGICKDIQDIKISRCQDASKRRKSFQKKIGAGSTINEFEKKKKSGVLRHVGLTESMHLIAYGLGWELDATEDIISPVIAKDGMVIGIRQIGKGYIKGRQFLTLDFKASLGEKTPIDSIRITGNPDITLNIDNGINGDIATCAIIVNALKLTGVAKPGLKTMLDIPVISYIN